MNTLKMTKYTITSNLTSFGVFLLAFSLVISLGGFFVQTASSGTIVTSSINGMEIAFIIFMFILGLTSFKSNLLFGVSNSVSRKSLLGSFILTSIVASAAMAIITPLFYFVASKFSTVLPLHKFLFVGDGAPFSELSKTFSFYLEAIVFTFVLCLLASSLGYFISVLFYRMSWLAKVIVSVGVPLFFYFVLPIMIGTMSAAEKAALAVLDVILSIFGIKTQNIWLFVLSVLGFAAVFFGIVFLMIRRVPVKQRN